MKSKLNSSARASALQIVLAISLLSISSILLASSFADALSSRRGACSSSANLVSTTKGSAALSNVVPATTCTVISTADSGPGTLRDCLAGTADIIDATGVSGTILLTSGELQITHNVTINGPGVANLAVDGNASFRVFDIFASVTASISGLTVTNGLGNGGGGILNQGDLTLSDCTVSDNVAGPGCCYDGGGIYNNSSAMLTITDSTVSGNSASFDGGGMENAGTLTVSNSIVSNNSAGRDGGGIDDEGYGPSITLTDSTISGNSANGDGGGVCACGYGAPITTVTDSTISGNSANDGGGIENIAQAPSGLTVLNSTISGNSATGVAQAGGGISNGGAATVSNSAISGNSAPQGYGGGVSNGSYALTVQDSTFSGNSSSSGGAIFNWTGGTTQVGNTVLNAGAAGGTLFDNSGTITSLGYNLASDNGGGFLIGPGDQINTDTLLGPLQDNGGPTFTHALLPGSPAIDAGDPSFTPPPDFDQRGPGYARVVGRIDIGSFEVQPIVTINVRTNPAGLTFSVDGSTYSSPQRFTWVAGSSHTLATTSPQSGDTGVRYVWKKWSDHGAISHSVAPTTNTIYTATFTTQYYLTMAHGTGGRVSPNSGWKNSGAVTSISATPARGYSFTNWTGSGVGSYSGPNNPASITMDGPITESATFTHN